MEWKDLSISDRAELIRIGAQNGLRTIKDIKDFYNKYKNGGAVSNNTDYYNWLEREAELNAKNWGMTTDEALTQMANDNTYNYREFYNNQVAKGQNGHYTDKYKTAYHPTFSEESMYSGKKSQYNPEGIVGGKWAENAFYLSQSQRDNNWNVHRTQQYLDRADPGYNVFAEGGDLNTPLLDGNSKDMYLNSMSDYSKSFYENEEKALLTAEKVFDETAPSLNSTFDFVNSYYGSDRYNELNIVPQRVTTEPADRTRVVTSHGDVDRSALIRRNSNDNYAIDLRFNYSSGSSDNYTAWVLGHEMAHRDLLFNNPYTKIGLNEESPYYGYDYSDVPEEWKTLLKPEVRQYIPLDDDKLKEELIKRTDVNYINSLSQEELLVALDNLQLELETDFYFRNGGIIDDHDMELNENYSDLISLKAMLYNFNNEWDGRKSGFMYTPEMIEQYVHFLKENGYERDRYIKNHSLEDVIKALNTIAYNSNNPFNSNDNTYLA